jgi:uncharacterized protein (TIRG00374 family)
MTKSDADPAVLIDRRTALVRWLVRLVLGLAIVTGLVMWRGGDKTWRVLQAVPWPVLAGSVVFYWLGQVLSAWKWQYLLRARGAHLSLAECCRLYLVGMFWNLWMPTNIGGDAVRAYMAGPQCGGAASAASSILVERLTGFLALLAIGVAGLMIGVLQGARNAQGVHLVLAATAVLVLCAVCVLAARAAAYRFAARAPDNKWLRKWAALHRSLDFYAQRERRPVLVTALVLSLLFQGSQVVLNIALARVVGLDLPALAFWWLVPLLALASLVPLGIGGLGVREAAAVALLHNSEGVAVDNIVAWSLLWQATVWLASLPGIFVARKVSHPKERAAPDDEPDLNM